MVKDGSDQGIAVGTFTAHRSPLGLVFDTDMALTDVYRGDGFCLSWTEGSVDSDTVTGPFFDASEDLLHLELISTEDNYSVRVTRIVEGFDNPVAAVLTGATLYVLESAGAHDLWEITLPSATSVGEAQTGRSFGVFPNPAADRATIVVDVPTPAAASLVLRDVLGRDVPVLRDKPMSAGSHSVEVDISTLAEGLYYYTLTADGRIQVGTIAVVR